MIDPERFWEGEHEYFAEIIRAFGPGVRRAVRAFSESEDDVDDLFQEIFTLVYEKRRKFRGDGPFAAWLNRVVINHCVSHYRKKRAEKKGLEELMARGAAEGVHSKPRSPEGEMDREEAVRRVWIGLEALPDKEFEAVVLRLIEGHSPREVSEAMGINKASVRSNISRGLRRLRRILQGDEK